MTSKSKLLYTFCLLFSLLLFFLKGIQYALLGSYVPIILSVLVLLLFYMNKKKKKSLCVLLKVWAVSIIIWSTLRILIAVIDSFNKELMENHLQENLGVLGTIISILFLTIGLFLLKKKYRNQWVY